MARATRGDRRAWVAALCIAVPILLAGAGCVVPRGPAISTTPASEDGALRRFAVSGAGGPAGTVAYWGNGALGEPQQRSRAVVVIHGDERNADEYFTFVLAAARAEGRDALIIAPRFVTERDRRERSDITWTDEGWKGGEPSTASAPGSEVSSFEVVDQMLGALLATSPAITDVVMVGHSAGGQFVQRYAAAASLPPGPRFRFVVANPSSYLYLDEQRPDGEGFDQPSRSARRSCEQYNRYKYGLDELPPHLAAIGASALREQYRSRDVTVLLGALDRDNSGNLDRSCAARLQGDDRHERGVQFARYVEEVVRPTGRHALAVVPGVGHNARAMLNSDVGRHALFDAPEQGGP